MTKTTSLACVAVLLATAVLLPETLVADCGKIVIINYNGRRPPHRPRPPVITVTPTYPETPPPVWNVPNYGQNNQQQQQTAINTANNNVTNIGITANLETGTVPPPPPAQGGAVAYGNGAFLESQQQAVVAWNGKLDASGEQTLILTTNESSKDGKPMAMLSVLPLPGRPVSVDQASATIFVHTKILLDKKISEKQGRIGGGVGYGVMMTKKIGSHNIFVWEMEDISTFKDDVVAYIADKYDNKATALVTDETLKVVKGYHDRGFRYFAFDLTQVDGKPATKEAIAYRFKSTFAYYPLAISAIGGTGHGLIDLVVMTPGDIHLRGAFEPGKEEAEIFVKGNTSVDFSLNEIRELDPKLAEVFGNLQQVRVRNFLFETKNIGSFKSDFIATATP
ncbi:MAG TPA: hypothetical protein DEB39_03615 [Planctomycetaceae bacterium]|nr:hypothetical protein [Planctomycetaceae bacterium]